MDIAREIKELHEFFVAWFGGRIANTDEAYRDGLVARCDPGFMLVSPDGSALELDALARALRDSHGSNPQFRIQVRNPRVRYELGDVVVVTYEEWQRNALQSTPADNGRLSTAVFRKHAGAPNGVLWLHVHETWLPSAIMAAGPYDF